MTPMILSERMTRGPMIVGICRQAGGRAGRAARARFRRPVSRRVRGGRRRAAEAASGQPCRLCLRLGRPCGCTRRARRWSWRSCCGAAAGLRGPVLAPQPGRVAIVTGGTDGIGYSTAKHLARLGMHVIIAGNNAGKAHKVVRQIQEETLNDKVEFLYCDLASLQSIRQFVQKFKKKKIPLHVLVNNAGVMMVPQRKTRDGFEEHFGLNYLGHFLLTNLLLDTMKESGSPGCSARVLTVSSATHYTGELNMDDLQGSRCYSPHGAYAQSKLALVLFTYHMQRLLAAQGSPVTANVVDPGVVNTDLYKHVFWGTRLIKKLFGWWFFKESIHTWPARDLAMNSWERVVQHLPFWIKNNLRALSA
uniref:dehydrogenase/reductase SDR family member on chromosome X n=1 Tax=Halichoerus grypus TaxID=9711 RepID=UPI001658F09A|nr:dehydrogenase/reductase SDR family member on chromosome X [Halichoerus grypus]